MRPAPLVETRVEYRYHEIPTELLECTVPDPQGIRTMGDVKDYLAELHYQGRVCERKARAVRDLIKPPAPAAAGP